MNETRDSHIRELLERVRKRRYQHYLLGMSIDRLRAFEDAQIRFDFPVTALVGPNGAGKTTVLGAAALIYEDVKPSRFFAKSGVYDTSMKGWRVEYDLLTRTETKSGSVSRTASYLKAKWNRNAVARPVKVIGISRTLPVAERREVYKFIGGEFSGKREDEFSGDVIDAVQRILGKEAANYLRVSADSDGKYSILAVRDPDPGNGYSEFHFGAGEASIIRIVGDIEGTEDHGLILIEEIENGLHPVATQRLVEYLIAVCRRKSCQVIFTTHSNYALAPLPDEAVWSAYRRQLNQGKLDVVALRTLTGEIEARLAIFTEDKFDELVCEITLRQYGRLCGREVDMAGIEIHRMGGAAPARDHAKFNNANPSRRFEAIAFLDGDKREALGYSRDVDDQAAKLVVFAPGDTHPETAIVNDLGGAMKSNGRVLPKLTLALQMDTSEQRKVEDSFRQRLLTNADRHLIFSQIGEDLDFLSEEVTARAFVSTWANVCPEQVRDIWDPVSEHLPYLEASPIDADRTLSQEDSLQGG